MEFQNPKSTHISFNVNDAEGVSHEVLKISLMGFFYKGEIVEDCGKAYEAFMQVMGVMRESNEAAERNLFEETFMAQGYEMKRDENGKYQPMIELMWQSWLAAKGLPYDA